MHVDLLGPLTCPTWSSIACPPLAVLKTRVRAAMDIPGARQTPAAGSPRALFAFCLPGSAISSVLPAVPPVFPPVLPAIDTVAYDGCCADYGCGAGDWGADDAYASCPRWSERHVILLLLVLLPPVRRGWLGWGCARWR